MMLKSVIVSGKNCGALAKEVSSRLGVPFYQAYTRSFPDGEVYTRLPKAVPEKHVVLFVCMGKRPNHGLIEALLLADAARRHGAGEITLVAPYMPYARQDSVFVEGEPLSIKAVAKLLEEAGISRVVTVDMHLHRFKGVEEVFDIPAINVSAVPLIAEYVKRKYGSLMVVAPDEEASQWASIAAGVMGSKYFVLEKERSGDEEVEITGYVEAAERVLIVDDIISTGGTIQRASSLLREKGVKDVVVGCTHALLVGGAEAKIFNSGVIELVATDTVPNPYAKVSVAPAIVSALEGVV